MSAVTSSPCIGVLALQGGYEAHQAVLASLNLPSVLVRTPSQLDRLSGLIIPGGESTVMLRLLDEPFRQRIKTWYQKGGVILGTCAGAILLAHEVTPVQDSLDLIDISVLRNGYGRQIDSRVASAIFVEDQSPIECVFIRAPRIQRVGAQVEVLVQLDDEPLCVRQNRCWVATFHPELSNDTRVHQRWCQQLPY